MATIIRSSGSLTSVRISVSNDNKQKNENIIYT
jgi:hypothetical protein